MGEASLAELLFAQAARTPDRTYVIHNGRSLSYGEMASIVRVFGETIRAQEWAGERNTLGVSTDNPLDLLSVVWSSAYAGKSLAFCPRTEHSESVREAMNQVGAVTLLTDVRSQLVHPWAVSLDELHAIYAAPPLDHGPSESEASQEEPSLLFQTSGTSGEPKWVRCEFWKCSAVVECMWREGVLSHAAQQVVFLTQPLFHSYGLSALFEYTRAGATIILPSGTSPIGPVGELRQKDLAESITAIEGVANFHLQLSQLISRLSLPALRHIGFGGGALDRTAVERLRERYPELTISVRYGLTETPSVVTHKVFRPPYTDDWRSSGRVVPIYNLQILGPDGHSAAAGVEGEIVVSGRCVSGYLGAPASNTLRTGDIGYISEAGELIVVGRNSAFLKYRGYRLSPELIESVIRQFAGVDDSRVLVVDQRLRAEIVCSDRSLWSKQAWLEHLADRLPVYAVPEEVVLVDSVPRTASGKLKRH